MELGCNDIRRDIFSGDGNRRSIPFMQNSIPSRSNWTQKLDLEHSIDSIDSVNDSPRGEGEKGGKKC